MRLLDLLKKFLGSRGSAPRGAASASTGSRPLAKPDTRPNAEAKRAALGASSLDAGELPDLLEVDRELMQRVGSLPAGMRAGRLKVAPEVFDRLPESLECRELELIGSAIAELPGGVRVSDRLNLSDSAHLLSLPANLRTNSIVLRNCRSLTGLPPGIRAHFLDLEGCSFLETLPDDLRVTLGRLRVRDCRRLRRIPESVGPLSQLDLAGCPLVTELPETLVVTGWIDIGQTAIKSLPTGCRGAELRWRSVQVDERIAFRPHEITGPEVLGETNAERRRVMLDRVGFDRFLAEVNAQVIDQDTDPGGPRKLLRVEIPGDEALVCVCVLCPSTGRRYILRVPPNLRTCQAAVAWTAGFDDPDLYRPEIET